jgi:predicted RecB family nuclease
MITSEIVVAYSQCKLKAYLLLSRDQKINDHEYISILKEESKKNKAKYLKNLKLKFPESILFSPEKIKQGIPVLVEASLTFENLKGYAVALTKDEKKSSRSKNNYTPTIVVGTRKISKEQKIQLAFVAYILSKLQKEKPVSGIIVGCDSKASSIKLEMFYKEICTALKHIKTWIKKSNSELPDLFLNKHCQDCSFQKECETNAIEKDDLSLLRRMSSKDIQKHHKKGIFTINQLSYLFKPRKQRKGKYKTKIPLHYRPELQALAIRTEKIYIQELPILVEHKIELFLDIEGTPDEGSYYLIGLLISSGDKQLFHSFWADSIKEERMIWDGFIEEVNKYPKAPIYHYGAYDSKAIDTLKNRYGKNSDKVVERLVNVNSFIYGKIYFPVKSNSLKELGAFIGAVWTHPNSSGLQSLVWRYHWNNSQNNDYRKILFTYNEEDCKALYLLTKELIQVAETADLKWNVDFADNPKKHATNIGKIIHQDLEQILQSAHADYDKNKISLKQSNDEINEERGRENKQKYIRIIPKPNKVIRVPPKRKCISCSEALNITEETGEHVITDLVFTKNGCRKSIIKFVGKKAYCSNCYKSYSPKIIANFQGRPFGHSLIAWAIYQRVVNRLPYRIVIQTMGDMFNIGISKATLSSWLRYFAQYYAYTEKHLIQSILKSHVIHADETKINIQGENHYVWVFTDGKHVVFKITETREAKIAHEFLSGYNGVLISDFYPGYDSINCRQQKCWVHLIRDINDDLWKEPFNVEFESFVLEVRKLIVPILQTIQKYGSKKCHLNKFKKSIELFYKNTIEKSAYTFEVTIKYQKRFQRYKDSLFIFMEDDGIPWDNNMAERAIRQLAVQRKISGTFYKHAAPNYLLLLAISQTCRFQNKSFLKFLISKEKNIDAFKSPNKSRHSKHVSANNIDDMNNVES